VAGKLLIDISHLKASVSRCLKLTQIIQGHRMGSLHNHILELKLSWDIALIYELLLLLNLCTNLGKLRGYILLSQSQLIDTLV